MQYSYSAQMTHTRHQQQARRRSWLTNCVLCWHSLWNQYKLKSFYCARAPWEISCDIIDLQGWETSLVTEIEKFSPWMA